MFFFFFFLFLSSSVSFSVLLPFFFFDVFQTSFSTKSSWLSSLNSTTFCFLFISFTTDCSISHYVSSKHPPKISRIRLSRFLASSSIQTGYISSRGFTYKCLTRTYKQYLCETCQKNLQWKSLPQNIVQNKSTNTIYSTPNKSPITTVKYANMQCSNE